MKALLRLLQLLLLLVFLLPGLLWVSLYSDVGTQTLLQLAGRVLPVELVYGHGSLGSRLTIERLRYHTPELQLDVQQLSLQVDASCLLRSVLCLREANAQEVILTLETNAEADLTGADAVSVESPTQLITFPLAIELESLSVAELQVSWRGGHWQQSAMQARVSIAHSRIDVFDARIEQPKLILSDEDGTPESSGLVQLPAIDLPLELSVLALELVQPQWDFYGDANALETLQLQARWVHSQMAVSRVAASHPELGTLALEGEIDFSDDWPLQARLDLDLAEPLPELGMLGTVFAATATGTLTALELTLNGAGDVATEVTATLNTLDPQLPFSAQVTATSADGIALQDIQDMPAMFAKMTIESPLTLRASGNRQQQDIGLRGAVSRSGSMVTQIALDARQASDSLDIRLLSLRDRNGNNSLAASGVVQWAQDLSWALKLRSDGVQLAGWNEHLRGTLLGDLDLSGNATKDTWVVNVSDVDLKGHINDQPTRVSGFAGVGFGNDNDGASGLQLSKSALQAEVNGASFRLHTEGDGIGPGHLQLRVDDLGRWQAGSRGRFDVQATISPDRQQVTFNGRASNLRWQEDTIASANLAGEYRANANDALTLKLDLGETVIRGIQLDSLSLQGQGDRHRQVLSLESVGAIQGQLDLAGTSLDPQWTGVLAPTRLQTPMGDWQLSRPVVMKASRELDELVVEAHCWQHQHAKVCPGVWSIGADGGGSLQASTELSMLEAYLPADATLTGEAQLQVETHWQSKGGFTATATASTDAVSLTQNFEDGTSASFAWDAATASFDYAGDGLRTRLALQRENRQVITLDLRLPPARTSAISGSLAIDRIDLAALAPLMPEIASLSGEINGQLALSGTVDAPLAHGQLNLTDGQLLLQENPTTLDNVALRLDAQGDRAQLEGAGRLGGGAVRLQGRLFSKPAWHLELAAEGENQRLLYPPATEMQVSERLQLNVSADAIELKGQVTVEEGVIEFESLPEDGVALSSSVVEVDMQGNTASETLPFDVLVDLQIHIAQQLRLTGKSVNTRLGGDLHVQQRAGQPLQIFGILNTVGGEFRAYQSRLSIKRGAISFTGPADNPTLDVRAERHISNADVTVGVQVQGPLQDDLELDLYSQPAMSQANAMSYLVRGRALDAGAGVDGTAAALSLASGVVNRSALIEELNRIPGVNNIEFGTSDSDDGTAATVSGYLGERLYLSYGVGLYDPVNVLTARFYLRSRLWLEVVSSLENSVDLYYSFDID